MIQSAAVLQMDTQELLQYLEASVQENPVLEFDDRCKDFWEETDKVPHKPDRLEFTDFQDQEYKRQDEKAWDPLCQYAGGDDQEETLQDHLLSQLNALELQPAVLYCVHFILDCLDSNGWLTESLHILASELNQPLSLMEKALEVVQSLEPAGIGARNLSECLSLQLLRRMPVDRLALCIAQDYLEALAQHHYGLIARETETNQEEVRRAVALIRTLNPHPGSTFSVFERPKYIIPDIVVSQVNDRWEVSVNDRFLPALSINTYYTRMLKENDDAQVKEYLAEKVRQARWVIQAIEQRQSTLLACVEEIVFAQENFFKQGAPLNPMTMAILAQKLGVHESTVSRAVNGKYLQCPRGTYPISYFFSRHLECSEGSAASTNGAKEMLKALIAQEDKRKPLSDQKICERMAERGCIVSRRAIAKYRAELGIPGTTGRKQIS